MKRKLMILEVSKKQDYIFGSKKLKENADRSEDINYVTSKEFFHDIAKQYYREENYIYSGGGHTFLQFFDEDDPVAFAKCITEHILRNYMGLELFVKTMDYDEDTWDDESKGHPLKVLSSELERKKARREHSVHRIGYNLGELITEGQENNLISNRAKRQQQRFKAPEGCEYPTLIDELNTPLKDKKAPIEEITNNEKACKEVTSKDNVSEVSFGGVHSSKGKLSKNQPKKNDSDKSFIAVIHIDGNSMGSRVNSIYEKIKSDPNELDVDYRSNSSDKENPWNITCQTLRRFSESIQKDFESAFNETVQEVICQENLSAKTLPIRPIILAGDDVCFVTAGSIGIECARIFLKKLNGKKNEVDQQKYAACAGVAIVHTKYPFHRAYQLAEELCSNAKKYVASIDKTSSISAIDWHLELGQIKNNLSEIRKEYETEDGNRLELRPYIVVNPHNDTNVVKDYQFFKSLCKALKEQDEIARSKVKELRTALKQGKLESEYFVKAKNMREILLATFDALNRNKDERFKKMINIVLNKEKMVKEVFISLNSFEARKNDNTPSIEHCLFYDAIEMMDLCKFYEEV